MAFVEPITIREAIENIHRKKYLLPAIQREFVWSTAQIERLFDSLMRDYPISSFLFWDVEKENLQNYQFYEFIRKYHERDNTHNPKADLMGEGSITAILDGQQRLTSLYIGLKGTYAYKLPRKRWDNDTAFPNRKLCLNLLSVSNDYDMEYDFCFLTEEECNLNDESHYWYKVGDALKLEEAFEVNDYLVENLSLDNKESFRFANKTLFKLYEVIQKNKIINFFVEKGESLDKVLNIFIRVNSGGTQLSYSDLLLSIATAEWKGKDAREVITSFVDEINNIDGGFNFNKDFVLKSCLVLGGFNDIAFKVDNFNKQNMLHIEKQWDDIADAIRTTVRLISSFGYQRDTLTSANSLIPIAYFLNKIGCPSNFVESAKFAEDRLKIFNWLIIALLKRTFGGQPDNVLRPIRDVINDSSSSFPVKEVFAKLKNTARSMSFNDDEVENLLYHKHGQSYTFSVLACLYPTLDYRNKFHQDHIFPKKLFTRKRLLKKGIPEDKIYFYLDNYNYLANLQLLEGVPNQEKSGKDFQQWLSETFPDEVERNEYKKKNYIPDIDYSLGNFEEFIEKRKKLIVKAFKQLIMQ